METKEEATNFIIEEAKRGNEHAYTDFCGRYSDCKDCPLLKEEDCRNIVFNCLIERLIKAEEKKELKPEYKLSKFEYDMLYDLLVTSGYRKSTIIDHYGLMQMREMGYFCGIPIDADFKDILENCVIE